MVLRRKEDFLGPPNTRAGNPRKAWLKSRKAMIDPRTSFVVPGTRPRSAAAPLPSALSAAEPRRAKFSLGAKCASAPPKWGGLLGAYLLGAEIKPNRIKSKPNPSQNGIKLKSNQTQIKILIEILGNL